MARSIHENEKIEAMLKFTDQQVYLTASIRFVNGFKGSVFSQTKLFFDIFRKFTA